MLASIPLPRNRSASFFASPGRSSNKDIACACKSLARATNLASLLDAMPDYVMILDKNRQILFANSNLRNLGKLGGYSTAIGKRPGELLNCEHAASAPSGCGTGLACRTCGAAHSILSGLAGDSVSHECRISTTGLLSLDLRVWSSPFRWEDENHVLVVATDISNEKRRKVLEHIFFHDLLNTASGICGIALLLADGAGTVDELKQDLCNTANALINEIKSQRILFAAESNELKTEPVSLHSLALLEEVISQYRNQNLAKGKGMLIAPNAVDFTFKSDKTLLGRVLGNLVKNALEACRPGETVTLGCQTTKAGNVFWCHNPLVIPPEIQLQIFQRSFSTKGEGRGIGTYSIRLLTERYLGGRVNFESSEFHGTTFYITLPRSADSMRTPVQFCDTWRSNSVTPNARIGQQGKGLVKKIDPVRRSP